MKYTARPHKVFPALLFIALTLYLGGCGRILEPSIFFRVVNAPGTSDFTHCEGGLQATFAVREAVMLDSPMVPPARIHRAYTERPADTTDNEPVSLTVTCYHEDGSERGYTLIETRWQPTVPGMSDVNFYGPVRAGGDASICIRTAETRGEPPCVVSPILR